MNKILSGLATVLLLGSAGVPRAHAASAIFGGGPFYSGGQATLNDIRASGFDTIVLWTIHVRPNGDLWFNDIFLVSNGAYVGDPGWPARLRTLKQAPTSVRRIEIGIGSAGVADYQEIRNLINAQGTGSGSILYRNFQALRTATGADSANFDDESLYDTNTSVRLGVMLADLGYRVTLCPYTNMSHWVAVRNQINAQRPGAVDRVHLQVYDGGAGNNPVTWNNAFGGGFKVDPGVWSRHGAGCAIGDTPAVVQSKMANWRVSAGITGGFLWLYDDVQKCPSQGSAAQYAAAINNGVGGGNPTPTPTPTPIPANVQVFQHCDYGGWRAPFNTPSNISTAQLVAAGGVDNDASSIRVAPGFRVTLFNDNNQVGTSTVLTGDNPCLVGLNFNDVASSLRIEAVGGGGVVFFQNTNFGGAASQTLPRGNYTLTALQARGVPNDWASSARIPAGFTVTMFADDNFTGTSWTRTSDTPSFLALSPSANDQMSSLRIQ